MANHSAILANYNGEKYLRETIDSVLAQVNADFELILVDDASTDSSARIMREYGDSHPDIVNFVQHDHNRGQGAGFNTGFEHSQGDLISFIDSDDLWFDNKLTTIGAIFTQRPRVALFHHNMMIADDHGVTDEILADLLFHGDLLAYWIRTGISPEFAPTSALSIPRATLKKILPMPEYKICADSYLARAAIAFGPVHAEIDALGAYRKHEDNNFVGNKGFDAWGHFAGEVVPSLREFYKKHEVKSPLDQRSRPLKNRILDASLRSLFSRFN